MRTIKVKSMEDFTKRLADSEATELADCLFEAIKKGIEKNTKKVAVCDVMIEDEDEVFRLYSTKEDWPVALQGCMKAFIKTEQYEKCSEIQKISHDYEIKKLLENTNKSDDKPKRGRKPKQSTDKNI
jgi:hypothetical protein